MQLLPELTCHADHPEFVETAVLIHDRSRGDMLVAGDLVAFAAGYPFTDG